MTKNLKRSIREKYKRRESNLHHAIEQYMLFADDRLNESIAGKARDKEQILKIIEKCKELLAELPEPNEFKIDPDIDIEELLGDNNTEEIIEAGKKWFASLTPEELEEIKNYKGE